MGYQLITEPTSFGEAAVRHLSDATLLFEGDRLPNADHLSGLAAECALKELVLHVPGAKIENGYVTANARKVRGHVGFGQRGGSVWAEIALLLDGRVPPEVSALLHDDPFSEWTVTDRYSDGGHLAAGLGELHLEGARDAMRALQSARLSNLDSMGGF